MEKSKGILCWTFLPNSRKLSADKSFDLSAPKPRPESVEALTAMFRKLSGGAKFRGI